MKNNTRTKKSPEKTVVPKVISKKRGSSHRTRSKTRRHVKRARSGRFSSDPERDIIEGEDNGEVSGFEGYPGLDALKEAREGACKRLGVAF